MATGELEYSQPQKVRRLGGTRSRIAEFAELVFGRVLARLLMENARAGLAGLTLYVLFRGAEKLTELADGYIVLANEDSAAFLSSVLSWGGAISGAAVWLIVTVFQLVQLPSDLKKDRATNG